MQSVWSLDLSWPQQAGLVIERGILADQFMHTNVPDIYAAGDAAQVYDPRSGHSILIVCGARRATRVGSRA